MDVDSHHLEARSDAQREEAQAKEIKARPNGQATKAKSMDSRLRGNDEQNKQQQNQQQKRNCAVQYWYDPMVPDQHFDRPGKSPFMDMQLVPKFAPEASPDCTVRDVPAAEAQP